MTRLGAALDQSMRSVGEPGGIVFTERQLYYELCRALRPLPGITGRQLRIALLGSALVALLLRGRPRSAAGLAIGMGMVAGILRGVRAQPYTRSVPITFDEFTSLQRKRQGELGTLAQPLAANCHPIAIHPDRFPHLGDYGLPRLLVCESDEIARMLLANQFHLELSCAILSIEEASPLPKAIRRMLRRAAGGRMFFLHDASSDALTLVSGLRQRVDLPAGTPMRILGLRPSYARQMHLFARRGCAQPDRSHVPSYLTVSECAWLDAGWQAEIAAMHPAKLLRALRRSMLAKPGAGRDARMWGDPAAGFMSWPSVEDSA